MHPSEPRKRLRPLGGIVGVALIVTAMAGPPAEAHSGEKAQLYVEAARLEPAAEGWTALVEVRDVDSGQLEAGYDVSARGTSTSGATVGPVSLADADADGRYESALPLTEGDWSITVEARQFVTGEKQALPFTKTWPATLISGKAFSLVGSQSSGGGEDGGGGSAGLMVAVVALVGVLAVGFVALRRRRPPAAPRP